MCGQADATEVKEQERCNEDGPQMAGCGEYADLRTDRTLIIIVQKKKSLPIPPVNVV